MTTSTDLRTYHHYDKIPPRGQTVAVLSLDVVLCDNETPAAAAWLLAKDRPVTWEVVGMANGYPVINFTGEERYLQSVKRTYSALGINQGLHAGKPPVARGEKRV